MFIAAPFRPDSVSLIDPESGSELSVLSMWSVTTSGLNGFKMTSDNLGAVYIAVRESGTSATFTVRKRSQNGLAVSTLSLPNASAWTDIRSLEIDKYVDLPSYIYFDPNNGYTYYIANTITLRKI
ncbi:hypothetical protein D3C76_999800 [compost metagenome]